MKFLQRHYIKRWLNHRLMAVILLLAIIPVLFFGTTLYLTGTHIVESEVERASENSILQIRDQVDLLTNQIEQFANQFALQSNVMQLLDIDDTPSIGSLPLTTTLVSDLSTFAFSLKALDSVYLYHKAQNVVLYPDGVTDFGSRSLPDTSWLEWAQKAAADNLKKVWIAPRPITKYVGDPANMTLSYIRLLPLLFTDTGAKAVLVINIKMSYLQEMLRNFPLGSDGGVTIFNEKNELITAGGAYATLNADQRSNITNLWRAGAAVSETARLHDPDVYATFVHSNKNGWTYVMLVPADTPVQSVQNLKNIIMGTTAVLCLLTLVAYYFSFQKFLSGVKRIFLLLQRGEASEASSTQPASPPFDLKFGQIEQRISRLIEENSDYREKQSELSAVIHNNYLQILLLGHTGQTDEMQDFEMPAQFQYLRYSLMIVEMDPVKPGSSFGERDEPLFLFAAANITQELLSETIPTEIVLIPKHAVIVLNLPDAFEERDLRETAETIKSMISKLLKHTVSVSVGRIVQAPNEISAAYHEALNSLQRRWLGDSDEVIMPGGTIRGKALHVNYPAGWEEKLFRQIRSGDEAGAREALQSFHEELLNKEIPFSQWKTFNLQLLVSAIRIFGNNQDFMDGRELYDEFMRLKSKREISAWIAGVLTESLPQLIRSANKSQKEDLIGIAFRIIEKNYAGNLSLQMAADECGVSASYLSELFKKHTGENFIQYVTNYRIEQSKRLLRNTELTVAQIAESVGYSNAPQLIRVFKKATGTTPGEYRTGNE